MITRADAGQHLHRQPVDLRQVLEDVARQAQSLHPDRVLRVRAFSGAEIRGDADALRRLLWILLDNAARHTQPGGNIDLDLGAGPSEVRLSVTDDGAGIPEGELERIFERFYRADEARTGGAAGLGLSIARWIAEEHGGAITASHNPVRGATFTVRLPLSEGSSRVEEPSVLSS